jgi:predicted RNA-binding Zn-ribbon protein involved in translation (DUF1610 family)
MLVFKQQRVMTCTLCKYKAVLAPDTKSPTVCPACGGEKPDRRTHKRVYDWADKLHNDTRLT